MGFLINGYKYMSIIMRRNEGLGKEVFAGGSILNIDNGWEWMWDKKIFSFI